MSETVKKRATSLDGMREVRAAAWLAFSVDIELVCGMLQLWWAMGS
jgi:hypothetical protein